MALFEATKLSISQSLKNRFLVSPFSILNTITQDWQRSKRDWDKYIVDSTLGRDTATKNATPSNTFSARGFEAKNPQYISTFDPFLCEVLIRWFSRENDCILDPFAGGSVRGIVSTVLGRDYVGIDLSEIQVMENMRQVEGLANKYTMAHTPKYFIGDSAEVLERIEQKPFNMLLTCPPYYNLERYSDNKDDLSNMPDYESFLYKYKNIIHLACQKLAEDSFAVIVVSEIRNKPAGGYYYGLVPDTINAFREAGLHYYNEIILENNVGSLPIRAPRQFAATRKVGRQHQNVLVFWKGDLKRISDKFKDIEI